MDGLCILPISKTEVWIKYCQTFLWENWNMFRLPLQDPSSLIFEAQSLTNSGKALGIVLKFAHGRYLV